eukprot:CFRG3721T1
MVSAHPTAATLLLCLTTFFQLHLTHADVNLPTPGNVKTYTVIPYTEIQLNLCQINGTYIQGEYVNGVGSKFKTGLIFFSFDTNSTSPEDLNTGIGRWSGAFINQNGVGNLTCTTVGGYPTHAGLAEEPDSINCTYFIKSGSFNTHPALSNVYRDVRFQRSVSLPNYRTTGQLCVPFSDTSLMKENWFMDTTKGAMGGVYCTDEELTNCPVEIDFCAPDLSGIEGVDIQFEWRPVLQARVHSLSSEYENAVWGLVASPTNNYAWGPGPFATINGFGVGMMTRPTDVNTTMGDFVYNHGYDLNISRQFDEGATPLYYNPIGSKRRRSMDAHEANICAPYLWEENIAGIPNLTSLVTVSGPEHPDIVEFFAFCTTQHVIPLASYLQFIITSTPPGETSNTTNAVGVAQYDPSDGLYKGVASTRSAWASVQFQYTVNADGSAQMTNATRVVFEADSDGQSGGRSGEWSFTPSNVSDNYYLITDACAAFVDTPDCGPTDKVLPLGLSDLQATLCNLKKQHAILLGKSAV